MKIAIAATSADQGTEIAMQGARAPCYLVFESGSRAPEVLINPVARAERGAGPGAAEFLHNHQVEQVIAGDFGPRFREELERYGIRCIQKTGVISEAIRQ